MEENTTENALQMPTNASMTDVANGVIPNKVAFVVIFCIFCVFGVIGNGSLVLLVIRFPRLRTTPNILMINLTIGDLLYIVSTLPTIIQIELGLVPHYETEALCKFANFLVVFGTAVCVYSMTALSVERYLAIVRGLEMRSMRTSRRVLGAMIFIWGMTLMVSAPVLMSAGFLYEELPTICTDMYSGHPASIAYACIQFTFLYILPLITMIFCYLQIAVLLMKGSQETDCNSRSSTNYRARKRLAIAMIVMAAFFGIFWFPNSIFNLYFQVNFNNILNMTDSSQIAAFHFFRRFNRIFAYTNSCFNPWILYFISTTHRRAIVRGLFCCVSKGTEENGGYRMVRMRTNGRTVNTFHSYTSETTANRTAVKPEDI